MAKQARKAADAAPKSPPLKEEQLAPPTQASVLAVLAFDDENGQILFHELTGGEFDHSLKPLFRVCTDYWHQYKEAPKEQFADIVAEHVGPKRWESLSPSCSGCGPTTKGA